MDENKLAQSAYISGGNPVGLPNYRPINKLPEYEIREIVRNAVSRQYKPVLYQVEVDTGGNLLRVGPRCPEPVAHALASAINTQVALGNERTWRSATVVVV